MINFIDPITAGTTTTKTPTSKLGKEDFMTLLVEQLKQQDPLNPMNSTDFTAQLAQFSSLEELTNINTSLGSLATQQQNSALLGVLDCVGKSVKAEGDQFTLGSEGETSGRLGLKEVADVAVGIYDSTGKLVQTLDEGWLQPGEHGFTWDGMSKDGTRCEAGVYEFKPLALNEAGEQVKVTTYTLGTVTGVKFDGTEPRLIIGGQGGAEMEVAVSDLTEVLQ